MDLNFYDSSELFIKVSEMSFGKYLLWNDEALIQYSGNVGKCYIMHSKYMIFLFCLYFAHHIRYLCEVLVYVLHDIIIWNSLENRYIFQKKTNAVVYYIEW